MNYLWEILVPTVRRVGGKPYRTRFHRVWDAKIRAIAGGVTILSPAKGQWISNEGELHAERMIPVRIMCSKEQIEIIAKMSLEYYDQIAIMYYRVYDEVKIVKV